MQLEELQRQWQQLDEKLDQSLKLQSEQLRQTVVPPTQRRIQRMIVWPALDIVLCVAVLLVTGSFLSRHGMAWSLAMPASTILIAAIALLISSIRQLGLITEIDWSRPVVEIQCALARLSVAKVVQFKWIMLLSPLVGFSVLIVGLQWLLDWSPEPLLVYDKLDPAWVIGNYVFGVLFVLIGYFVARYLSRRFQGRGWWRQMLDGLSDTSIQKARQELDRWANLNLDR